MGCVCVWWWWGGGGSGAAYQREIYGWEGGLDVAHGTPLVAGVHPEVLPARPGARGEKGRSEAGAAREWLQRLGWWARVANSGGRGWRPQARPLCAAELAQTCP